MAENQGVNGDIWNDRAVALLEILGWEYLGDKNIDIKGSDGKEHGIDAVTMYDSPNLSIMQSCLVESKRYAMSSLSPAKVKEWIETLKNKMEKICDSEELLDEITALKECCQLNLGIIMCWVHDATDDNYFTDTFQEYLRKALFDTMAKPDDYKRIIVLTNPRITRLCSMAAELNNTDYCYSFIYPSQLINGKPLKRSNVLSVDYMSSNIVLAERTPKNGSEKESVVFYFGSMKDEAFDSLYDALTMYNIIEAKKKLIIFHYEDDEKTRIVEQEAKKRFKDIDISLVALQQYDLKNEPAILKRRSR